MTRVILKTGERFPKITLSDPRGFERLARNKDGQIHWENIKRAYDPYGKYMLFFSIEWRFTRGVSGCSSRKQTRHRQSGLNSVRTYLTDIVGKSKIGQLTWLYQLQDWTKRRRSWNRRTCTATSETFVFGLVDISGLGSDYNDEFEIKTADEIEEFFKTYAPNKNLSHGH